MNCLQKFLELHEFSNFQSNEGTRVGPASKSEIRRWFSQNCIEVNFNTVRAEDEWPSFIKSIVMFPKNKKKRCTLWFDDSFTLIQIDESKIDHLQI